MKLNTRKTLQELSFLALLLLGGYAIAKAQDQPSNFSKKVKIEVEVTENGSKSTTVTEKQMDQEGVDRELDEMVQEIEIILEEAVNDMDETDLEIIIRRNGNTEEPRFRKHMMVIPDAPLAWNEESEPRAFLGVVATKIEGEDLDLEKGARINKVVKGSAAEKAGLKEGDIITVLDGKEVSGFSDVAESIRANQPGDKIKIELLRDGKKKSIEAELGKQQSRLHAYSFDWDSDDFAVPHPPRPPHIAAIPNIERFIHKNEPKVFLGIVGKTIGEDKGVQLQKVYEGSTAEEMGLVRGDEIHKINGEKIEDIKELVETLSEMEVDDNVEIEFVRDGKKMKKQRKLKAFSLEREHERVEVIYDQANRLKEYIYRIEMNVLSAEEIRELNKKSDAKLDENNSLSMEHFTVSPNPSNGVFILDMGLEVEGELEIQVFDASGRSVYENEIEGDGDIVLERIDISDQESGMYYISVKQNGKGKISRVVKH